jgi:hypothetical protein
MARPTVVLDLSGDHKLARDLAAGGVFVPGCALEINQDCELVVRSGTDEVRVAATVVWVDGTRGAGLQLVGCDGDAKQRLAALAGRTQSPSIPPPITEQIAVDEPDTEPIDRVDPETDDDDSPVARNMHERLRGLSLAQQIKLAHKGEVSERIVLERMYGKNVWEALLRNPRLTGPEVARIARMGALPRQMMEIIVGNGAWLQIPEVRRALLSNPRLGTDQILRVLRLLPKHELKLAALQTAYPMAVRDNARKMLRENP